MLKYFFIAALVTVAAGHPVGSLDELADKIGNVGAKLFESYAEAASKELSVSEGMNEEILELLDAVRSKDEARISEVTKRWGPEFENDKLVEALKIWASGDEAKIEEHLKENALYLSQDDFKTLAALGKPNSTKDEISQAEQMVVKIISSLMLTVKILSGFRRGY